MATKKNKRKPIDWQVIRAEFETGGSYRGLADAHGVSHTAIRKRAEKEGWTQDLEARIRRETEAKVSGTVSTANPEKQAAAVDAEAERRAEVIRRHRNEWNHARERAYSAMHRHRNADSLPPAERKAEKELAFKDAMMAKITSETFAIIQEKERKAWNITNDAPVNQAPTILRFVTDPEDEACGVCEFGEVGGDG